MRMTDTVDGIMEKQMEWEKEDVNAFLVTGTDLLNKSDKISTTGKSSITPDPTSQGSPQPQASTTDRDKTPPPHLTAEVSSPKSLALSDEDLFEPFSLDIPSLPHQLPEETEGAVESQFDISLGEDSRERREGSVGDVQQLCVQRD